MQKVRRGDRVKESMWKERVSVHLRSHYRKDIYQSSEHLVRVLRSGLASAVAVEAPTHENDVKNFAVDWPAA